MSTINTALTLNDLPSPPPGKSGWPWTEQNHPLQGKMPPINIVTPSYNQGKFIEATIRSVLLQGYPNLEYIIIDGGSTDDSVEIIKKYQPYLSYWVSEKDTGQADAINKGIKKSSGEIIGWINSDDVYVKGTFNKVIQAFNNNLECVLVHGNRIFLDASSNVTGWANSPPFEPSKSIYTVCSETAFWRRSAMNNVGLLKDKLQFAMDLEFFCRLYKYGEFVKLKDYLGYLRCHDNSKSSTIAHIGKQEAQIEWHTLFGDGTKLTTQQSNATFFRKILDLTLHPVLIGMPYLRYRLTKYVNQHFKPNSL